MKIGIVSQYLHGTSYEPITDSERAQVELTTETVRRLDAHLAERGVERVLERHTAATVDGGDGLPVEEIDADAIVSVGGDGTILRTVQRLDHQIPILGINTGRVGFLADVAPERATEAVDALLDGFEVERRSRVSVSVGGEGLPAALNDVVVTASTPAKIMEFDVHHDGQQVESIRADGMIVATPTGSTAYSMSVGGPLVDPTVDAFVVVPIAPFRMRAFPWVLNAARPTRITPTRSRREGAVVVDGRQVRSVERGESITFERAAEDALFVQTSDQFFGTVRRKLIEWSRP